MDSQTIVNLENVRIQDTKETKIASLSWQMNAGEAWLVIGANGGGKSDFLDGLAGTKQILRNKDNSIVNVFDGSAEVVSLERAARLIEEERELDESE
nr:ABC transporter [Treponema sp.]